MSLLDDFVGEARRAFQDIRENLIERGWFGRPASRPTYADFSEVSGWSTPGHAERREPSFEELWATRESAGEEKPVGRDLGMDR